MLELIRPLFETALRRGGGYSMYCTIQLYVATPLLRPSLPLDIESSSSRECIQHGNYLVSTALYYSNHISSRDPSRHSLYLLLRLCRM